MLSRWGRNGPYLQPLVVETEDNTFMVSYLERNQFRVCDTNDVQRPHLA